MRHAVGTRSLAVLACALLVVVATAGCQSKSYDIRYELRVTEAVVEKDVPEGGPGTDEIAVKAVWTATSGELEVRFTNPADTMAVVLWDGATISRGSEEAAPLVNTAPTAGPELPQPPTVIPRRGQVAVSMLPHSGAEWEWLPNRTMGGFWKASDGVFGVRLTGEETGPEREALAASAVGRKVIVKMQVRTGRRVLTHIYDIRVSGAEVVAAHR